MHVLVKDSYIIHKANVVMQVRASSKSEYFGIISFIQFHNALKLLFLLLSLYFLAKQLYGPHHFDCLQKQMC